MEKEGKEDGKVVSCLVPSKTGFALSESDGCLKLTVLQPGFLDTSLLDHL